MAFWLHLVPKLHRIDNFQPVFHAPRDNSTDGMVLDDAKMTHVFIIETASTASAFRSSEDGSVWMSSGPDELETRVDGLSVDSTSASATGAGSRLLLATLAVGGTLLLINSVIFMAMLAHRSRRFKQLKNTKPIKPITYVITVYYTLSQLSVDFKMLIAEV